MLDGPHHVNENIDVLYMDSLLWWFNIVHVTGVVDVCSVLVVNPAAAVCIAAIM